MRPQGRPKMGHWLFLPPKASLLRLGWQIKRQTGSHRTLARIGWSDVVFASHDGE